MPLEAVTSVRRDINARVIAALYECEDTGHSRCRTADFSAESGSSSAAAENWESLSDTRGKIGGSGARDLFGFGKTGTLGSGRGVRCLDIKEAAAAFDAPRTGVSGSGVGARGVLERRGLFELRVGAEEHRSRSMAACACDWWCK